MKFNEWIAQEVKRCNAEIDESRKALTEKQAELKIVQKQKSDLGRNPDKLSLAYMRIEKEILECNSDVHALRARIDLCKIKNAELKKLSKMNLVRLKTGAVVSSKIIDEMLKKLSGKHWSIEYTQYQDGLQIAYINAQSGAKGSLKVYHAYDNLPDEVELPLFDKGGVKKCSIRS